MNITTRPSVCLVDDEQSIRNAFRLLLKSAGIPLVSYPSAQDFLSEFDPEGVGCIILDVRLPGMTGLELQEVLHQRKVQIPIIILTGHADVPLAVQAVKAGAFDVIQKPIKDELLLDRIHKAFAIYAESKRLEMQNQDILERIDSLTPREKQVLELMVSGKKNKDIAQALGISPKTLDIHRSKVMGKMKARTVADLVRWRLQVKDVVPAFTA